MNITAIDNENDLAKFSEVNGKYFLIKIGSKFFVGYYVGNRLELLNKEDFPYLECEQIEIRDGKRLKPVNIGTFWLGSTVKRIYNNFCFKKIGTEAKDEINLWKGFKAKLLDRKILDEEVKPFTSLVYHNLTSEQKASSEYVLNWCADFVQCPFKKNGIALVFQGPQGIGKTTFTITLASLIYDDNFFADGSIDQIFGQFDDHLMNKYFISSEESLFAAANINLLGKIKHRITSPVLSYNGKFKGSITLENYSRYVFTSNNDSPAPVEKGNRRFFVAETQEYFKKNSAFFKSYYDWLHNPNSAGEKGSDVLFTWLMQRDISKFNVQDFPKTGNELKQVKRSLPAEVRFLIEEFASIKITESKRNTASEIYRKYVEYCNRHNKRVIDQIEFGKFLLNDVKAEKGRSSSGNHYTFTKEILFNYYLKLGENTAANTADIFFEDSEDLKDLINVEKDPFHFDIGTSPRHAF